MLLHDAMPFAWPSLSDLAREMNVERSTVSRMPVVLDQRYPKIGRQVKVPPDAAVAVLVARGFSRDVATATVGRIVRRYLERIPAASAPPPPDHAPATAPTRLTPSSIGTSRAARLTPARLPQPGPEAADLAAMSPAERLAHLDRMLGARTVPIEQYVYEDR